MDKNIKRILDLLPKAVTEFFDNNKEKNITEIRLRVNSDVVLVTNGKNFTIQNSFITADYLGKIFLSLCDNTISAYEEQIANGYITIEGGIRIGIGGRFSVTNGNCMLSDITSLNIRLLGFHNIEIENNILDFKKGLLICGKPHSGKTTFVRNICRYLNGSNYTVCDERGEIYHTSLKGDFIINIPKAEAIVRAVRVMNPDVIICDEIGSKTETQTMLEYLNTGVKFVCTVHCNSYEELYLKPNIAVLLSANVFDKILFLENTDNKYVLKGIKNV